jgi:hypothetical protein
LKEIAHTAIQRAVATVHPEDPVIGFDVVDGHGFVEGAATRGADKSGRAVGKDFEPSLAARELLDEYSRSEGVSHAVLHRSGALAP